MTVKGTDRPSEKTCNTEGCNAWATKQSDRTRCDNCGGKSTGPKTEEGKKQSSRNAITHGAQADPHNLRETLTGEDKEWVDALTNAYVDESPYGENSPQAERIETTVIMAWQERSGRATLIKEGLERETVVGTTEHGAVSDMTDHHLNGVVSSLNTDIRMNLKDLGLLHDPDTQRAEAEMSLADALSDDS